jgi:ribonuclease Z
VPASGLGGVAQPFQIGPEGRVTVLQDGNLRIDAFWVDHAPIHPAVGYRVQYKGRTVVTSGDTQRSAALQRQAQGVGLLLHEALSRPWMAILENGADQAGRPQLARNRHPITRGGHPVWPWQVPGAQGTSGAMRSA